MAAAVAAHVVPALATGRIRVPVCETFPLAEAQAAYDRFAEGAKLGKVVLVGANDEATMIEAVLFDGDQTLWDFERVMRDALTAVADELRRRGPGPSPTGCPGRTSNRTAPHRGRLEGVGYTWPGSGCSGSPARWPGAAPPRAATCGRTRRWRPNSARRTSRTATGTRRSSPTRCPASTRCGADYRLGLLSNGSRLPETVGLAGYFESVVFAQDHRVAKPDKGIFEVVERELGVGSRGVRAGG